MHHVEFAGCTATPFGNYLKALGILRLISEQADRGARGWWNGDTFVLESRLDKDQIATFFLEEYRPTPILAPWNGGSGFYPKDNKTGIDGIAASKNERFALYREAISICREMSEVQAGKGADEDERRTVILRKCRNYLPDAAVEWLDAAVGIAADGSRSFAPVLGTGGNEGRLDYTNNFMARIVALLIQPERATPVKELLANSLFAARTSSLQAGAAGQFDPGRAGGANQGQGIESDATINPWDLVMTLEGAVAWASGLYRRQGVSYRSVLCSPFTVRASRVGYGSATDDEDARAEVWTPLWMRPTTYAEIKTILREGRASVDGRPAKNGLEFAEAACSLGVDRGIPKFVRYSLLKRRGDSYVALPAGTFDAHYRSEADRVRQFQNYFDDLCRRELPKGAADLRRPVESAVFNVLLHGGAERLRGLMSALGRMLRRVATTSDMRLGRGSLNAGAWLDACGFDAVEVRIAAALASIYTREVGSIADNLSKADKRFAWIGRDLTDRMISVLDRRIQLANAIECEGNPLGGACAVHPGDVTLFIDGAVDDGSIEDLVFAFLVLDWRGFGGQPERPAPNREVVPVYAVLKHLFLPGEIKFGPEPKRLRADPRVVSLLKAGQVADAAAIAVHRLRVAGLRPLEVNYSGGADARRLAAALLIPVQAGRMLAKGIFKKQENEIHELELAR